MHNIIEVNKRNIILKADYKLTEKIITMYQKNKINREEFVDKLKRLRKRLEEDFTKIKELNKRIENKENKDINYYIAEHLLTNEYFEIAEKFIKEKGISIDYAFFENLTNMKEMIRKYDFSPAVNFIKENKLNLKNVYINYKGHKINGMELENLIKLFTFMDMCKKNKKNEAIQYLRENFDNNKLYIKKYMVLIVSDNYQFKNDLDVNNIEDLCFVFSEIYLSIFGLTNISRLAKRVTYGLIAYKTELCGTKVNYSCPTCLKSLKALKDSLPRCKRENSIILCKGSNVEMNEKNQPFCFESGYIYCEEYMSRLEYVYTCVVTGKTCKENPKICYFV